MEDLHSVMHGPSIGMQCHLPKRATMTGQTIYEGITLHNGDCREIMREMPADHFDAIITDPPYGIAFKGEKWDTATPRGFQSWCESWAVEALRIVKPGGYLLAFSAPRTYHRLAAGIEDAGFEIRDTMAWLRADGKASAVDLSAMFDRSAGVLDQREGRDIREWADKATATRMSSHKVYGAGEPVTDEAKAWAGWGVGLKPAWEPIVVARRPIEGRLIDNARAYGTGAMNIRSAMDAVGGSYPPNLMVSEAALAAAVDQGAPDHGWPVFKYQPKAPTHERPKVGGGTARDREAPRSHAVPDPACGEAGRDDPRAVRRVGDDPTGRRNGGRERGRV